MDEREIFAIGGASASDAERLEEASRTLAVNTGISLEEAAGAIQRIVQYLRDGIETAAESLKRIFHEIEEVADAIYIEPRARRRKRERTRRKAMEQRFRVEIRRAEGERIYRRIYKPP